MKQKKIPSRMCLGCNEMKPKHDLIRIVKPKEGQPELDLTGKKAGRGAYICKSAECFRKARKSKRFERTLSCTISDELYESMERQLDRSESAAENE